uniref:Uncharacterized protein n=1 Tax=Timema poppense TaxID=170557 RepID=A0A7R9CM54_TIMPO|nr:unnamed protein product [Timema poppensis]
MPGIEIGTLISVGKHATDQANVYDEGVAKSNPARAQNSPRAALGDGFVMKSTSAEQSCCFFYKGPAPAVLKYD